MRTHRTSSVTGAFLAASLTLLAVACSGGGPPAVTTPAAESGSAADPHAGTFDAAKTLAAASRKPLLVDLLWQ
jgi:hypothetical protein